ncbi:MAG: ssDNA-binding domain-containing protein [Clostridia bacterium]|nr:ssDNA-binding domain-containing protein [Clostridia bacterium]
MNKEAMKEVKGLDRLTPERQDLVCMVMDNLNSGLGLWHRNWTPGSAPVSAVTGRSYRGVNNLYLSMIAMRRGYKDNRWATYNQIQENGWRFKTGNGGGTLAKGKSVAIEFFEFRDKKTKEAFDLSTIEKMSAQEKEEYMQKNVYPLRKVYRVFNGDLLEGLPEKAGRFDKTGRNDRVEDLLSYWSKNQSRIVYGGDDAYYVKSRDEIHLPPRESFGTYPEFYSTTLHELSHSTAHSSRLNRDFYGYGSEEYSVEELRAEISSLFLCQEYGVKLTDRLTKNESAYIRNWVQSIRDNPDALFKAIADADKISRYVLAKENEAILSQSPLTIPIRTDESAAKAAAKDAAENAAKDAGAAEKLKAVPEDEQIAAQEYWPGRKTKAIQDTITSKAAYTTRRADTKTKSAEEVSRGKFKRNPGRYMPPSQVVSKERTAAKKATDPIIALSDVSVYEHAAHTRSGERFLALYNGRDLLRNIDKSRATLFSRLAVFSQDEEQLCRIVRSSALYDKSLPDTYYKEMAHTAVEDMKRLRKEGVKSSMPKNPDRMPQDGEDKTPN